MISAAKSKLIRSLHQKKYRDQHQLFLVEGEKMVLELASGGSENPFEIRDLIASPEWLKEHHSTLQKNVSECIEASPAEIKKVSLSRSISGSSAKVRTNSPLSASNRLIHRRRKTNLRFSRAKR